MRSTCVCERIASQFMSTVITAASLLLERLAFSITVFIGSCNIFHLYLLYTLHWKDGLNWMFQTNPDLHWWISWQTPFVLLSTICVPLLPTWIQCLGPFFLPDFTDCFTGPSEETWPAVPMCSRGLGCCTRQLPFLEGEIELSSSLDKNHDSPSHFKMYK